MIFDSHAHYDDKAFDADRDALLGGLRAAGVGRVMNVGASWRGVLDTVQLAERWPFVYGAAGIHPDHVGELSDARMEELKQICRNPKIRAVGEIGLDYYWDNEPHDVQRAWFIRQLALAKEVNLPVIIHSREAAQETFDVMKREHAGSTGGVIHCFSGSVEMAREYVKMGYYIGIGGVATFKNARVVKDVVREIPLKSIVVETDCPYLAPVPHRGKRNSSMYLPLVIEAIAQLKGVDAGEVEAQTWANACALYHLPEEQKSGACADDGVPCRPPVETENNEEEPC